MSEAQTDDSTSIDKEKTVTFVGYLSEDIPDIREAVDEVFEFDYLDTYMDEETTRKFIVDGEERKCWDDGLWQALREENLENVKCVEETKRTERYKNGIDSAVDELAEEHFENTIPDAFPYDDFDIFSSRIRRHDDFSTVLRCYSQFEEMRLLKHIDEAEGENQFVDDDETEYPALKAKMTIEADDPKVWNTMDEEVVQPFYDFLWDCSLIERVRVRDCEITKTEKGACLNV